MIVIISTNRLVVFDNNNRRVLIQGNDMKGKILDASPEGVVNLVHHCYDAIANNQELMITTKEYGNILFNNTEDLTKLN